MLRKLLPLLVLAATTAQARAESVAQAYWYELDSATYTCVQACSSITGACRDAGLGRPVGKLVTTSGASSATVTSVNTDAPFAGVSVGDVLSLEGSIDATTLLPVGQVLRRVSGVASVNSITINTAVIIPATGSGFRWFRTVTGTGAEDGWWGWPENGDAEVFVSLDQFSATSMDYKIEGRQCVSDYCTAPIVLQTDNLTGATAAESVARLSAVTELLDQVRVCLKINTDNAGVVITATTDDIDFTEDAAGTPKVCRAVVASATYSTGASACVAVAAAMNTAGICGGATNPDNTYACAYSSTTGKITISRSAGTKTIDLNWATGANTATSAKTALGYANSDDTGATSYVGDSAVDTDEAVNEERISVTVRR